VTVDFERGYGLAPTELVERLAATGAVGMNLEDSALGVARVSFGPTLQLHLYRKFGSALLSAVAADENPLVL
jgi:2-methylisocitrate lyase-like PEP mutase family enzyme